MTIGKAMKRIHGDKVLVEDVPVKPVFLRTPYNYDMDAASRASGVDDEGVPSMTVQSEKDNSDINVIVKRFGLTGALPQNVRVPEYGDFEGITDFHSAMNAIKQAEFSFMQMPAEIRSEFDNDPGKFVDFCSDPDNLDRMRELGLAVPSKEAIIAARNVAQGSESGDGKSGKDGDGEGAGSGAQASGGSGSASKSGQQDSGVRPKK